MFQPMRAPTIAWLVETGSPFRVMRKTVSPALALAIPCLVKEEIAASFQGCCRSGAADNGSEEDSNAAENGRGPEPKHSGSDCGSEAFAESLAPNCPTRKESARKGERIKGPMQGTQMRRFIALIAADPQYPLPGCNRVDALHKIHKLHFVGQSRSLSNMLRSSGAY